MEEKEEKKRDLIKWFPELSRDSTDIVGGKAANLAEIYNLKIPVPPGFVVTVDAYNYFIEESGLKDKIKEILDNIDYKDTKQLNESAKKIRELMIDFEMPDDLKEEIVESYENLDVDNAGDGEDEPLDILNKNSEEIFVAVRSSATTEDLEGASFAGQQETFLNVKGKDDLLEKVKKCFASLFTARATYYRHKKGFKHEGAGLAVVVQKMVNSDKSGVIFSKDPSFKNDNIIIESVFGLGEGIVSGKITPDKYVVSKDLKILKKHVSDKKIAVIKDDEGKRKEKSLSEEKSKSPSLSEYEINKLAEFGLKLEKHYDKPQDIEFAIEGENIYIVQTRAITTMKGRIEEGEKEIDGEVVLKGAGAAPGIGSGKIKIVKDLADLEKIKEGDVLVTKMTNPDMVVSMQKSAAIVTDEGGMTSHAAIVSREMGIPCIVGTREATTKLKEGEIITVNGSSGKVYKGKVAESTKKEVKPVEAKTKTKIKVIVDLPNYADRAAKTGLKGVGLTRIEGIIAESGKHPNYFLEKEKMKDYEEVIYDGISKIAKNFEELWIRTSDIRSNEYKNLDGAPKEEEANPMLGFHGIRFGLKNPEILKSELRALKRVAGEGKKIGLILPQIILAEEVQKVKEFIKEIDFKDAKVGVMIETPASVQIIDRLCKEGIDFISFGTNDLTQYTLAIDRGNEEVLGLYDELNPAILRQLAHVIKVCKENDVETSICGQAGSKKEMVKFLVGEGINSISVNADMANDIAEYISKLEEEGVENKESSESVEEKKEEKQEPSGKEKSDNVEDYYEKDEGKKKLGEEKKEEKTEERQGTEDETDKEKKGESEDEGKEDEEAEKDEESKEAERETEQNEEKKEEKQSDKENKEPEGEIREEKKELDSEENKETEKEVQDKKEIQDDSQKEIQEEQSKPAEEKREDVEENKEQTENKESEEQGKDDTEEKEIQGLEREIDKLNKEIEESSENRETNDKPEEKPENETETGEKKMEEVLEKEESSEKEGQESENTEKNSGKNEDYGNLDNDSLLKGSEYENFDMEDDDEDIEEDEEDEKKEEVLDIF